MTDEDNGSSEFTLTPKQSRIVDAIAWLEQEPQRITYSHSTLCQTSLPFKNTGTVRTWKNRNGDAVVVLTAGEAYDPSKADTVELGLPYGAKPRLILLHLNSQAIKTQSPIIEVEDSLYAFLKVLRINPDGREYRRIKDQLGRLAAAHITIGRTEADGTGTTKWGRIVDTMNVFFPKDHHQRILWPNTIQLSQSYFQSLCAHAVPLDHEALYALRDSALELDLYAMLAERLHRISPAKPHFIPWDALYQQYGSGFSRARDFRKHFVRHLHNVQAVYKSARLEETKADDGHSQGITLFHSQPPVLKKNVVVLKLPSHPSKD
jgi:Plasmid encoded RepA protein